MTKTKRQLRAEAVERLWNTQLNTGNAVNKLAKAVGAHWNSDNTPASIGALEARLIYLLTDDDASAKSAAQDMDNGICVHMCPNDSREKLEEDANAVAIDYWHRERKWGDANDLKRDVIALLDRQAAITQHEITERWAEHLHPIERKCGDLRRKVDELTAERDKLQEQLLIGWECECRLQAERERYREKFGKCLDYADAIHALMDDEGMA